MCPNFVFLPKLWIKSTHMFNVRAQRADKNPLVDATNLPIDILEKTGTDMLNTLFFATFFTKFCSKSSFSDFSSFFRQIHIFKKKFCFVQIVVRVVQTIYWAWIQSNTQASLKKRLVWPSDVNSTFVCKTKIASWFFFFFLSKRMCPFRGSWKWRPYTGSF